MQAGQKQAAETAKAPSNAASVEWSINVDAKLACALVAIAGALNAAVFHAVGFFAANMTGNVSAMSDHVAQGEYGFTVFLISILFLFISGAMVSTAFINAGKRRQMRAIFAYCLQFEGLALAVLGLVDLYLPAGLRETVLIGGLSFLMGLQNAIVTQTSHARIRTTHISGMVTDIGIGLGMLLDMWRKKAHSENAHPEKAEQTLANLKSLVAMVGSFFVGGALGVVFYLHIGGWLLPCMGFALFMLGMAGWRVDVKRGVL